MEMPRDSVFQEIWIRTGHSRHTQQAQLNFHGWWWHLCPNTGDKAAAIEGSQDQQVKLSTTLINEQMSHSFMSVASWFYDLLVLSWRQEVKGTDNREVMLSWQSLGVFIWARNFKGRGLYFLLIWHILGFDVWIWSYKKSLAHQVGNDWKFGSQGC